MVVPLFEADKYSYFEFLSLRQRYENMALLPTAETVPNLIIVPKLALVTWYPLIIIYY
jgi:hypothetical protein